VHDRVCRVHYYALEGELFGHFDLEVGIDFVVEDHLLRVVIAAFRGIRSEPKAAVEGLNCHLYVVAPVING